MRICTVATHSDRYFPVLKASCERFQTPLIVLGWGEQWQGFAWKFAKMLDFLNTISEDEIVMFVDGYDVILLQPPSCIEKRFLRANVPMIVAQDGVHPTLIVRYFMSKCFHDVNGVPINTGTYIGYAGYLKQFLRMISIFSNDFATGENDQEIASRVWRQFPDMVTIDHNYQFFITLYGGNQLLADNQIDWSYWPDVEVQPSGTIVVHINNQERALPCVVHGPCNTNLNDIVMKLGYKIPESVLRYTAFNHMKYMVKAFHSYTPFIILWLVLWMLVICSSMYCMWVFSQWFCAYAAKRKLNNMNNVEATATLKNNNNASP